VTEVNFHTGMADPLDYACRLLRKAQRRGGGVVVAGDPALLDRLDVLLWSFDPLEFLPHVRIRGGASPAVPVEATPIWLTDDPREAPHHEVLVNLGPEVSAGFESFRRLFELVGLEPQERDAGRRRWQHFKTRGYPVVHQEMGA
jgi:DNA polymerase-3 subunit chi